MIKAFIKDATFAISILLFTLAIGFIVLIAPIRGNKALIVRSGSMQPTIGVGDLIAVKPQQNYNTGDIVAFKDLAKSSTIVTHRIAAQQNQNGKVYFQTKGDANEEIDFNLIPAENIIGKSYFVLPQVGKIFAFVKTKNGFLTLAIGPALLVILLELTNIYKEVSRSKRKDTFEVGFDSSKVKKLIKLYEHYGKPMGLMHPSTSFRSLLYSHQVWVSLIHRVFANKLKLAALPIMAALFVVGSTYSQFLYTDAETSIGNVFQAASFFPPQGGPSPSPSTSPSPEPSPSPSPGNIVINEVYYRVSLSHRFGSEAESEWAELYNSGGSPVDLTGWSIEDNTSCDNFPGSPIIPAGGFAIVTTASEATFRTVWPTVPVGVIFITSPTAIGNGLANNDELMLRNGPCTSGSIVDHVSWGSNTNAFNPSVPSVSSDGISIERGPDGTDTNTNADFVQSNPPTPGS